MKTTLYALLGISSVITLISINQFNIFNINVNFAPPEKIATAPAQSTPLPCYSEECQRVENMKKLAEEAEKRCITVTRDSAVAQGKLVQDTITTHSQATKLQDVAWQCQN